MAKKPTKSKELENKKDYSILYATVIAIAFFCVIYLIYLLLDSITAHNVKMDNIHHAKAYGYEYIQYIVYNPSSWWFVAILAMSLIYSIYLSFIFLICHPSDHMLRILFINFVIAAIPYCILTLTNKQTVDDFMYPQLNNLYNITNNDKKFEQTDFGIKFKKALDMKDYKGLKEITNDFKSLAKVPDEKLKEINDVIHVIPVPELNRIFNEYKSGYTSYSQYDDFYNKAVDLFINSEYKDNPEFILLINKIKITTYDFNQLKIDIL